eukprot:GHVU01193600.1.p3 GENE.GHVU01193600.1~~GHVU01193600.1.p3  ORF type:complete len:111 (-),score=24.80 GHVU01193600.1:88-420(-)
MAQMFVATVVSSSSSNLRIFILLILILPHYRHATAVGTIDSSSSSICRRVISTESPIITTKAIVSLVLPLLPVLPLPLLPVQPRGSRRPTTTESLKWQLCAACCIWDAAK